MIRSQRLLIDRQSPPQQRLGGGIVASLSKQDGEVPEVSSHLGMIRSQCVLLNRQSPPQQRLGGGVIPGFGQAQAGVVQDLRVMGSGTKAFS